MGFSHLKCRHTCSDARYRSFHERLVPSIGWPRIHASAYRSTDVPDRSIFYTRFCANAFKHSYHTGSSTVPFLFTYKGLQFRIRRGMEKIKIYFLLFFFSLLQYCIPYNTQPFMLIKSPCDECRTEWTRYTENRPHKDFSASRQCAFFAENGHGTSTFFGFIVRHPYRWELWFSEAIYKYRHDIYTAWKQYY